MSPTDHDEERPRPRRSWPQRLLIAVAALIAVASFAAAGVVWIAQQQLESRQIVAIDSGEASGEDALDPTATQMIADGAGSDVDAGPDAPDIEGATARPDEPDPNIPVETFPLAEPGARNILITGADNNACLDPDSRFAPAFGDRENTGERSDTIMMWRVNPATSQVAILSFPRDLWVNIDGRSSKGRINAAYQRDDPQRLINTIQQNFAISTDHFVQVDFCAFKELVDSVG